MGRGSKRGLPGDLEALLGSRVDGCKLIILPCLNMPPLQSIQGHICPSECGDIVPSNENHDQLFQMCLLPSFDVLARGLHNLLLWDLPSHRKISDLYHWKNQASVPQKGSPYPNLLIQYTREPHFSAAQKIAENFNILLNSWYHFTKMVGR